MTENETRCIFLSTDCRYRKIWNSHIVYQSTNWQKDISQTFLYLSLSLFIHYQIIIIGASTSIATKGAEFITRLPLRFGEQHLSDTFHFLADNTRTRVREGALLVGSTGCVIFRGSLSIIVAFCGSSSQDSLSRKWSTINSSLIKNHPLVISSILYRVSSCLISVSFCI